MRLHPDDIRAIARAVVAELAQAIAGRDPAPEPTQPSEPTMSQKELAAALRVTVGTLRNWRAAGVGPTWSRFGQRVRYSRADVNAWLASVRGAPGRDGHALVERMRRKRSS